MMSRVITLMFYQTALGSSPRVWGQDSHKEEVSKLNEIIPTRVGTRSVPANMQSSQEDHPHACGDKFSVIYIRFFIPGSSPHVWGQDCSALEFLRQAGIIPTRMGTSLYLGIFITSHKDHPHAYGDKTLNLNKKICNEGSSPRVWGQEVTY